MADEFDGCECFWSHELSARRLLNIIRQSQDYCTDTECIDLPSLSNPGGRETATGGDGLGGFTTMTMMLVFAVMLFLMRPNRNRQSIKTGPAIRGKGEDDEDRQGGGRGGDEPPSAPPAVN